MPLELKLSNNFKISSLDIVRDLVSDISVAENTSASTDLISQSGGTGSFFILQRMLKFLVSSSRTDLDLKIAARVLFLRVNTILVRPSHSMKLMLGIGFMGSIRTTLESTWMRG